MTTKMYRQISIKPCGSMPCTGYCTYKKQPLDKDDFGYNEDIGYDFAEPYCCGDNQFIPIEPTDEVLKKYNITLIEFLTIQDKMKKVFSVGSCGWCE